MSKNYSQNDSEWQNQLLGHNTQMPWTLGNYGCLITSLANACDRLGINQFESGHGMREITPYWLDVNFTEISAGYSPGGGDYIWGSLNRAVPVIIENDWLFRHGHKFNNFKDEIKTKIESGNYQCVIEIDSLPDTITQDQHWVLIDSINGDTVNILDSWDGRVKSMAEYFGATVTSANDSIYCAKLIEKRNKSNLNQEEMQAVSGQFHLQSETQLNEWVNNHALARIREAGGRDYIQEIDKLTEQNTGLARQLTDKHNDYVNALDRKAKAEALVISKDLILHKTEANYKTADDKVTELKATIEDQKGQIERLGLILDGKQKTIIKQGEKIEAKPPVWSWVEFIIGQLRSGFIPSLAGLAGFGIALLSSPEFLSIMQSSKGFALIIPMLPMIIGYLKTFKK